MNENLLTIWYTGFHECADGAESIMIEGQEVKGKWVQGYPRKLVNATGSIWVMHIPPRDPVKRTTYLFKSRYQIS